MKKRVAAVFICLFMLLDLIAIPALAETIPIVPIPPDDPGIIQPFYPSFANSLGYNTSSANGEAIFNALLKQEQNGSAPEGFTDDTLTPYGTQKGEAFTLVEKAEVFEYTALNENVISPTFHDNMTAGETGPMSSQQTGMQDAELKGLRFAQSCAFDATGSGRRDHVAVIGFRYDDEANTAAAHLYIVTAESKTTVYHARLASNAKMKSFLGSLTTVDMNNFVQITAGDYNDNGRDSIVFYAGLDLYEASYTGSSFTYKKIGGSGSTTPYLHSEYKNTEMWKSYQVRNQLGIALASGDLNGDGIDDLVSLTYTGDHSYSEFGNVTCIPELTVGYGIRGAASVADLSRDSLSVRQTLDNKATTMACPGVAVGDLDGDGKAEIIAAGYINRTTSGDPMVVEDGTLLYGIYKTKGSGSLRLDGSLKKLSGEEDVGNTTPVSPIARGDSLREAEQLFQQLSVECIAFNGLNRAETVFISGYFSDLDSSGTLAVVPSCLNDYFYDPEDGNSSHNPFFKLTTQIGDTDVDEVFIHSASVGNITGSNTGEEAILLVIGYKKHTDPNVEGTYHFQQYAFSTRHFNITGESAGTKLIWHPFIAMGRPMYRLTGDYKTYFIDGAGGSANVLLTAVDYGTDSVVARYNGKAFGYTDPSPVAFLQAAPYFAETDPGNNSTQYSYSEGYRVTTGSSDELSFNVGFAAEIEAGAIKSSMEMGLAYELNKEFLESIDKTYTTTFDANDQNQVILRQTLMYYYGYDLQYLDPATGQYAFKDNALIVSAPQYPVLTSLSMDQYNEFAAAYNTQVDAAAAKDSHIDTSHKMELISDEQKEKYFLNNEGDPFAYASQASEYTYNGIPGWDLCDESSAGDTDTWMRLSHAGGTQSQAYTVTLEKEKTTSVAEGGYANMSVMAGGNVLGSFSAYAGATAGYERLVGHTRSTASLTSTETSGTVQNLSGDMTSYGFSWKLIGWKTDDLFAGVPFVGYAVKDQTAPPPPASDLKASFSADNGGTVTLTWMSPEEVSGRPYPQFFYVHCDQQENYVAACKNNGAGLEHSITVNVKDFSPRYATFTVSALYEGTTANLASAPSNEVYVLFAMSDQEVNDLVKDLQDKIAALKAELEKKDTDLAQAITDLIAAYKAADETLKAKDEELAEAQEILEEAMAEADQVLQETIDKVNDDLTAAIEELSKNSEESLAQAVTDLTDAYSSADELLKADIDTLNDKHAALGESMAQANTALRTSIGQVEASLTAAKRQLETAAEEDKAAINERITTLSAALDTAYKLADEMIRTDLDSLSTRHQEDIDALSSRHQEDIDALRAEIETLKVQINEQTTINVTQQKTIHPNQLLAIIALCLACLSLIGNGVLLYLLLRKKAR